MSSGGRISLDIHRSCCEPAKQSLLSCPYERSAVDSCHCEPAKQSLLSCPYERSAVDSCHCEPAKQSLFSVCQPFTTEIAALLSLRACEAISLCSVCQPRTTEIASSLAMTGSRRAMTSAVIAPFLVIASLRSNLVFIFISKGQSRSPRYARDDRMTCEAISPLSVCRPLTTEIAALLSLRACEAISLFCLPAPHNRDRFVPRDDSLRRAQRGNLSFLCLPSPDDRDRCPVVIASLRSDLAFLFANPEQPRSLRSSR